MNKRSISAVLFVAILSCNISFAQKKKPVKTTTRSGAQDRELWVKALYKMAYPVIHNLANSTLVANMPLEKAPGYGLNAKKVTYLEALGRTMAGVAPWLALPDDNTEEGKLRKNLRDELLKGLANSVDPSNPDYMNYRTESQPIVDAAYVALGFLRAPKALWEPLDPTTKKRFVEEFKALRTRSGAYNNWLLFAGETEGFLLSIGEQSDPARINFGIRKLNEWYVGDGWFKDGEVFSMDYYNSYVIHPMMVNLVKVLVDKKRLKPEEYDKAIKHEVRYAEFLERQISPEGTYPIIGRSSPYRTATFQSLAEVALLEKLPTHLPPAQVRCALTSVIDRMFTGNQNYDDKGWLVLGLNGHQPEAADYYTSTGSLYMATLGFLPLGLPADNKFWSDPYTPWTSIRAWCGQPTHRDHRIED
ncbi:DUF2264 domain-containing protein [Pedobacter sp. MW01-1-1]|uniref:DUF2264 domain-containing protein n=1 Tax=Pedobacter sp. MW01-1-1 TaxID=3383027 RepID=UPI003FEF7538